MSDKVVGKWLKRITMMRLNDANNKKEEETIICHVIAY